MNKNQKQIREIAKQDADGQTYAVHHQYDRTIDDKGNPTSSSFVSRTIPHGRQTRLSKAAKVGAAKRHSAR